MKPEPWNRSCSLMFGKDFVEPFVCLQWTSSTVMAADAQSMSHLDLWWACPDVCAVGYCWFMYLIWSYMILYCIFRELQDDQRRDDSDDIFFFAFDWRHLQIRDAPLQSASVLEPGGGAFRLCGSVAFDTTAVLDSWDPAFGPDDVDKFWVQRLPGRLPGA